jgi:hypothetical protein
MQVSLPFFLIIQAIKANMADAGRNVKQALFAIGVFTLALLGGFGSSMVGKAVAANSVRKAADSSDVEKKEALALEVGNAVSAAFFLAGLVVTLVLLLQAFVKTSKGF